MLRIIALLLAFLMTQSAGIFSSSTKQTEGVAKTAAITEAAASNPVKDKKVGDLVGLGSYPTKKVTDTTLIKALDKVDVSAWISYGYYKKSTDPNVGIVQESDYMKFADISYNGKKYRAVRFSQFRPVNASIESSIINDNTYQNDNGYSVDTTYYFEYEQIRWIVIDPAEGYLISQSLLDSQPFNNYKEVKGGYCYGDPSYTTYATNWEHSSLREWLNNDFYNTAFTNYEKSLIGVSHISNKSTNTDYPDKFNSGATHDKIFIPSASDVTNSAYGFSTNPSENSTLRTAFGTDYAKCQGLEVNTGGKSSWRLRTCVSDFNIWYVNYAGNMRDWANTESSALGVRVALKLDPQNLKAKVTFDPCGGTVSETSREVEVGEKIGTLPTASLANSTFEGWFSKADGGYKITSDEIVDEDVTFYAHWYSQPSKLIIESLPTRLNYGIGEQFDYTGVKLAVEYTDGRRSAIDAQSTELVGFDSSKPGTVDVHFRYVIDDVTLDSNSFKVDIGKQVTAISIVTKPNKIDYVQGEHFDPTGIKVTALFDDGTVETVTNSVTYSDFDDAATGAKKMTVSYEYKGKVVTAEYDYYLAPRVESIKITSLPTKLVYELDDAFSEAGLVVEATYADGTSKAISNYTLTGFDSATVGKKIITVTYNYGTQTRVSRFSVMVK
ncbi:MAG: bacterial Ig-like domain-containing protein [Clostridia bacterium]|nr:bacterial Ig-like domain-containing protein [Clostridia bacterium]